MSKDSEQDLVLVPVEYWHMNLEALDLKANTSKVRFECIGVPRKLAVCHPSHPTKKSRQATRLSQLHNYLFISLIPLQIPLLQLLRHLFLHTIKMVQSSVLGFPRMGANRDLKKATEAYWAGKLSMEELLKEGKRLRLEHWTLQKTAGVDIIPSNDFAYYDHVLDHIQLFNVSTKNTMLLPCTYY